MIYIDKYHYTYDHRVMMFLMRTIVTMVMMMIGML